MSQPPEPAPRRPKRKKAATLTMRLTQASRDALQAEADATGRSLSEMAERWIDEARTGRATVDALLGGTSVAPAVREMVAFAKLVSEVVGDPSKSLRARGALLEGWRVLLLGLIPPGAEAAAGTLKVHETSEVIRKSCEALADALDSAPHPTDFMKEIASDARAVVLNEGMDGEMTAVNIAKRLKAWGEPATPDIQTASQAVISSTDAMLALIRGHSDGIDEANNLGRRLANEWRFPGGQARW